jgi:hypothetical protein
LFRLRPSLALCLCFICGVGIADAANATDRTEARQQFVLDLVNTAVAVHPPDPEDRLRILVSAATTVRSTSPVLASQFAEEGLQLEAQMIRTGQKPDQSMLNTGLARCSSALDLLESLPPRMVFVAEQEIIGLLTNCGESEIRSSAERKLQSGVEEGSIAPRALLAAVDLNGSSAAWSQQIFRQTFSKIQGSPSLDSEASALAEFYARVAPSVPAEVAVSSGLQALQWLGQLQAGRQRTLATTILTSAMRQTLGDVKYAEALRSNVSAAQATQNVGATITSDKADTENVSVLRIMASSKQQDTEVISRLPAPRRAREFAAHGFIAAKDHDPSTAKQNFDAAFNAVQELWNFASASADAVPVLNEVVEASAKVDIVQTLSRAQSITEPTTRALALLTLARIVQTTP